MSVYDRVLPEAFVSKIVVDKDEAKNIADFLIGKGSSFAVTADRPVTIWLSWASNKYLTEEYLSEEFDTTPLGPYGWRA